MEVTNTDFCFHPNYQILITSKHKNGGQWSGNNSSLDSAVFKFFFTVAASFFLLFCQNIKEVN